MTLSLMGLFFLLSFAYSQDINRVYWDSLKSLNKKAYDLTSINLDSAETINSKILENIQTPIDTLILSDILSVKANIYFEKGNYDESLRLNLKSLDLRKKVGDSIKIGNSYNNIANIYYMTDNRIKCREYIKKGIDLGNKLNFKPYKNVSALNTLALSFFSDLALDSAAYYFKKCLKYLKDAPAKYDDERALAYGNYSKLLEYQNNYEEAIRYLDSSSAYNLKVNDIHGLCWNYSRKGEYCLIINQLDEAYQNLLIADSLSQYSSTLENKKNIKYFIFKYFLLKGEVDSALKYNTIYYELNNSLITYQTSQNLEEMEAKYQVKEKQAAIELGKAKNESLQKENKAQENYLYLATLIIILISIASISVARHLKNKRKLAELELEIKDSKLDELLAEQESKAYAYILKGQEKERERIAQDLHDRLGGTLAALKLALRKPENKIAAEDLKIIDTAVLEVRNLAHNMSSGLVNKYGLKEALSNLFNTLEKAGGLSLKLYIHPKLSILGQSKSIEIYRIVQELLSNTLKHAEATEVSLQTNYDSDTFNFIFEDNGKGFDPAQKKGGIGLQNIESRVQKLGGEMHLDTKKGRGTIVIIDLKHKA